jgi:hypothetical protein
MSIAEFQQAVPPRGFDDFRPWIDQMKEGKPEVLCQDPVLAFEKTSGSTTAAKYIPFTGGLRAEFQEAVRAWMGDLFARFPAAAKGPAWWLVSPLRHPREVTAGGIPVGMMNTWVVANAASPRGYGPCLRRWERCRISTPVSTGPCAFFCKSRNCA